MFDLKIVVRVTKYVRDERTDVVQTVQTRLFIIRREVRICRRIRVYLMIHYSSGENSRSKLNVSHNLRTRKGKGVCARRRGRDNNTVSNRSEPSHENNNQIGTYRFLTIVFRDHYVCSISTRTYLLARTCAR